MQKSIIFVYSMDYLKPLYLFLVMENATVEVYELPHVNMIIVMSMLQYPLILYPRSYVLTIACILPDNEDHH